MRYALPLLVTGVLALEMLSISPAAEVEPLLKALRAVGPEGAGHREAAEAWRQLSQVDAAELPTLLAALDGANPLAANWIRTAVDTIAQRQVARGGKLPAAELERFLLDRQHAPRARRLAYEWLLRADPGAAERLIPGMLDDPSLEMRRDAVARLVDEASRLSDPGQKGRAVELDRRALAAARDIDQIRFLADRLRRLGQPIDLARQFGFLVCWRLIGPFDNTDGHGYDTAYPPEKNVDFTAECAGKHGPVRWVEYTT